MTANNVNLLTVRIAVASCVDKQIGEADTILTALENGSRPGSITNFRAPPSSLIRDSEWQSERASQVLTHFPRDELAIMSRYYAHMADFKEWERSEGAAWRELSILEKPPAHMAPSDLIRLRVNLSSARYLANMIAVNAGREMKFISTLGIGDTAPDPVRAKNYCTMNAADYQRYRNAQDLR